MGDISDHYNRSEFACRCGCGRAGVDHVLLLMLEEARADLGHTYITPTSGFRCPEHNRRVGGAEGSFHLTGQAADWRHGIKTPTEIYEYLNKKYPEQYGIGLYVERHFIHLDSGPYIHTTRKTIRRWRGD